MRGMGGRRSPVGFTFAPERSAGGVEKELPAHGRVPTGGHPRDPPPTPRSPPLPGRTAACLAGKHEKTPSLPLSAA